MGLKKTPKPKPVSEAVNASHKLKKGTDVCQRNNGKKSPGGLALRDEKLRSLTKRRKSEGV